MTRAGRQRRAVALAGLCAAALAIFAASPASAASQEVLVEENVFVLPGVAVKPGESVTWKKPNSNDRHNVKFEDGSFEDPPDPLLDPWERTRTFSASTPEGEYRYFCEEHGGPGGSGMSGKVYVNATGTVPGTPPTASFTVTPSLATVRQNVSFDATASSDPDGGPIIRHEWDLDSNGSYETDTGATATTSQSYLTAGMRTIKLRVTDGEGQISETTRPLSVKSQPTASFTVAPNPARTGQTVSFNGSASSDPDGTIAKYEWDLDGDGSFETDTATTPTTSRAYTTPASLSVRLRVTDEDGFSAETTRSLGISAPVPPKLPPATPGTPTQPILPTKPAPVACTSLKGAKRTACAQKSCRPLKGSRRARCIEKSCRYVKGNARAKCIRKSCRYLKGRKRAACNLKSCRALKGSKKRACVRKYRRKR